MAFDDNLAARIRSALARKKGIERRHFGCFCLLLNGNVLVGVWKNSLIVRLGNEQGEEALLEPHVRPFDITGKPMKGWIVVEPEGIEDDDQLKAVDSAGGEVRWRSCQRNDAGRTEEAIMRTEKEKMLAGELYDPLDPELVRARERARDLCQDLNATRETGPGRPPLAS